MAAEKGQSRSHTRRRQSAGSSRPTTLLSHHQHHQHHQSNNRRRSPHKTLLISPPTATGLSSWWPQRKNPRKCSAVVASSAAAAGAADSADSSPNDRSAAGAPGAGTGSDGNLAGSGSPDGDGAEVAVGIEEVRVVDVEDGGAKGEKAHALPGWVPRWAVEMHPAGQAAASVGLYMFHMLVLSKSSLTFPVQVIPNNYGLCQSVGLDTATGFAVLGAAGWLRARAGLPLVPPLRAKKVPWKLDVAKVKERLPVTFIVLVTAYLVSGLGSQLCEYLLYMLSFLGISMSVAMHRSVQVLMSHLVWVVMGIRIIGLSLRPFFNREKGSWVGMKWKSNWLWWVVGGYFVSSSFFNMADLANQFVCPLPPDTESVVVKIINPENNDVAAMAVGSIAPCITAPWWEEVLYRGFLLPALTVYMPLKAAIPSGALLFAAHHMNLQAMLPLSVLGLVWSLLYVYSGNLLVTVLIHAMWNSRVFLGSLLGL